MHVPKINPPPHSYDFPKCISSLNKNNSSETKPSFFNDEQSNSLGKLTTREVHHTETEKITDPIDLTGKKIIELGADSSVVQLQRGVVRLRVEVNGETVGAGSGIVISSDGLILSVNHVPALGERENPFNPFQIAAGTQILRNLKSWSELLGQKGDTRLVADFPILPKPEPPDTIFTPRQKQPMELFVPSQMKVISNGSKSATAFTRYDDTIEHLSVPIQIVAESPNEDLMIAKIVLPEQQKDPYPYVKITDSVPSSGDFVYSIGHPKGIKHNALALGEVLDPDFDITKIKKALEAHGVILGGVGNIFGVEAGGFVSSFIKGISIGFAGINTEVLTKFLNGALISTNRIDHGSSGGLLCNESGEAVGITYLGMLIPFNDSAFLRYAAGVLSFHPKHLPLSSVTGSVGMKKAIPFLESHGVSIAKIRDGEPSGIENIEEKAARKRAREAFVDLLKKQNTSEAEISKKLKKAGLEEEPISASSPATTSDKPVAGEKPKHYIGNQSIGIGSKPVQVIQFETFAHYEASERTDRAYLKINIEIKKENEKRELNTFKIDPDNFSIERDVDPVTYELIKKYLANNPDKAVELYECQQRVKEINSGDDKPPEPPNPPDPSSGANRVIAA